VSEKMLTRDAIIQSLVEALKPLDYVHAFYEGGAAAFNRIDEWSDIDLYLVIEDEKVGDAFAVVENALKALSPIKQKYEIPQLPWPGVSQAFYRLEHASEYLIIDLAVLKLSSPEKFLTPEIHGSVVFYIRKPSKVAALPLDRNALEKKLWERLARLRARFEMFSNFVQKEINRRNYLEAIDLYYALMLAILVEALRIRYKPIHHDFKMKYVRHELPALIVQRLKLLYFVRNEDDLRVKYQEAAKWFQEIVGEIDKKKIDI